MVARSTGLTAAKDESQAGDLEGEATRLRLTSGPSEGPLDGGWWPRTRDLQTELLGLLEALPPELGRVHRALYSPPDWSEHPRSVNVGQRRIKTGSFPTDDTHLMVLTMSNRRSIHLLVVPPDHQTGSQAMTVAAEPSGRWSASQILAMGEFDHDDEDRHHWHDLGDNFWRGDHDKPPSHR